MADSFALNTDRPWPNPTLEVGAIVGHTTPASVRLWVRTGRTGRFALLVFPQEEIADAAERSAMRDRLGQVPLSVDDASALVPGARREDFAVENLDSDTTAVVDLDGLAPDTRYGYLLHFRDGERVLLGHNRLRGCRTPPAYDARRPFQFALCSCHMPYRKSGLFRSARRCAIWRCGTTSALRCAGTPARSTSSSPEATSATRTACRRWTSGGS